MQRWLNFCVILCAVFSLMLGATACTKRTYLITKEAGGGGSSNITGLGDYNALSLWSNESNLVASPIFLDTNGDNVTFVINGYGVITTNGSDLWINASTIHLLAGSGSQIIMS